MINIISRHSKKQKGMSLVGAIFLIVVLSLLAVFMHRLTALSSTNVIHALVVKEAHYAAVTGMQWTVLRAKQGDCTTVNNDTLVIGSYTATIACAQDGTFVEEDVTYQKYMVSVVVIRSGTVPGDMEYVRRRLASEVKWSV